MQIFTVFVHFCVAIKPPAASWQQSLRPPRQRNNEILREHQSVANCMLTANLAQFPGDD